MAAPLDPVGNGGMYFQSGPADQQQPRSPGGAPTDFDDDRKLFLGGLSWETTEDDLIEYFNQYGQVTNVNIKYNASTGNPRGFGFITFANEDTVDTVLAAIPHSVKGKVIDPRKAKSKTSSKKIFVGGVDSNTEEDKLRDYFSRYGKVDGIELPFDKIRNRRREFCFIIFDTKEAADAACQESKQYIAGRECDIKRAQPQMNGGAGRGLGGRGGGRGAGGAHGGPNNYGHHQPHHMAYGQPNFAWGQQNGFDNGGHHGYGQPQGGWSNGPRQHGGPAGRGGHPGRQFHKPRVYTGTPGENGHQFHNQFV